MADNQRNKSSWNSLEARMRSEQLCMKRITNDDLVCKDCMYRFDDSQKLGNTSKCEMFEECKPHEVLLGHDCCLYDKDTSL